MDKYKSKYVKLYGLSSQELAVKFKVSCATVIGLHKKGLLQKVITDKIWPTRKISKSKYRTLYGSTLDEIAKILNKKVGYVLKLHWQGKLKDVLG